MKREIKFRAWDGERLGKVNTIGWVDDGVDFVNTPRYSGPAEDFRLMQYTGLKDKNGFEIYEYSELDGTYEVIFKDLRYSLRHTSNNDIIDLYDYWRGKNGEIEVTREYTKV